VTPRPRSLPHRVSSWKKRGRGRRRSAAHRSPRAGRDPRLAIGSRTSACRLCNCLRLCQWLPRRPASSSSTVLHGAAGGLPLQPLHEAPVATRPGTPEDGAVIHGAGPEALEDAAVPRGGGAAAAPASADSRRFRPASSARVGRRRTQGLERRSTRQKSHRPKAACHRRPRTRKNNSGDRGDVTTGGRLVETSPTPVRIGLGAVEAGRSSGTARR
jgi:hypothetical protein